MEECIRQSRLNGESLMIVIDVTGNCVLSSAVTEEDARWWKMARIFVECVAVLDVASRAPR